MAAHEEKDKRVVFLRRSLDGRRFGCVGRLHGHRAFATAASRFGPDVVGHPPEGNLRQPGAGIVRRALARPLHRCGECRLLNGILRYREVAKSSDHSREHLRRQFPQQVLDRNVQRLFYHSNSSGGPLITCRTSMGWFSGSLRARGAAGGAPPKPARRSDTPPPGFPRPRSSIRRETPWLPGRLRP